MAMPTADLSLTWEQALEIVGNLRPVVAAGGIVTRVGPADLAEIVLVHRPGYDDWTLPKGKLEPKESLENAALREVEEETGLRCRIVRPGACTRYIDRKGREKVVFYWMMVCLDGSFSPHAEVDEVRWLTLAEADGLLTYDRDRTLLRKVDPLID